MTQSPKEKAEELIKKFSERRKILTETKGWVEYINSSMAKTHALVAVDELIDSCYKSGINYSYNFWQDVKKELEKL